MMKCLYNGLKLGHNLVKRRKEKTTQIKISDWSNRWGFHTQRQEFYHQAPSPFYITQMER